jgi:hypothetical protein
MKQKTIYIAGPMSGLPEFNHPAFYEAEARLAFAHKGARIINPARNDIGSREGMTDDEICQAFMRILVKQIAESDMIFMLEGWEKSRVAVIEHDLAVGLNLIIRDERYD